MAARVLCTHTEIDVKQMALTRESIALAIAQSSKHIVVVVVANLAGSLDGGV